MNYFFIQQINEYMYYVPGTVQGSKGTSVNKTRQNSMPLRNIFTTYKKKGGLCSRIPAVYL